MTAEPGPFGLTILGNGSRLDSSSDETTKGGVFGLL